MMKNFRQVENLLTGELSCCRFKKSLNNEWFILKVLYSFCTLSIGISNMFRPFGPRQLASTDEDRTVETCFDVPMFSVLKRV